MEELILKILLSTLLMVWSVTSNPVEKIDLPDPQDFWNDTQLQLLELNRIVTNAITVGLQHTDSLETEIQTFARNTNISAEEEINNAAQKIREQLRGLETLAGALNASHCVADSDKSLEYVIKLIKEQTYECIDVETTQGLSIVQNISLAISYAQLKIAGLGRGLQMCKDFSDEGKEDCIMLMANEIDYAKDELPAAIMDRALEALLLSKDIEITISRCGEDRMGVVYTEGQNIISEVENCLTQTVVHVVLVKST